MKKKEWMQSENPINLQSNQISLNEFELFEKFDENLEEKEWNLQQIREFYSLLYQYKPRNYVSKLLENNLNYNQEEYMEILGFNKKILICKILGIGLSVAGITTMILNLFISVSPLALLGLLMTGIGSLAISKSPNYFYNYYNKKFEDYYLEHHHTWGGREGFIDSVAELMVKVFDLGNPSSLNILGAISNLGIKHLDNSEYNGLPTKEELDLYKELKNKVDNKEEIPCFKEDIVKKPEKSASRFLIDIKNDINKVNESKYNGYEEDLDALINLAQDFILETAPKDDNSVINLEGNNMASLYKRLVDLEQRIENRIKRKEYIEDNTSFVIEDLGTQLSVDKLDQSQQLKLTLKNYKG